jgi:hypothetical protein
MSIVSVNIMGGLGNQLFQIATAYAYAQKENGQLKIYKKKYNGNRPVYWDTLLKMTEPYLVENIPNSLEQFYEKSATVYSDIGHLLSKGKYLNGYFQSSKYFYNDKIKEEIRNLFKPDIDLVDEIRNKYKYLCDNYERVIVIHARRTDYIKYKDIHGPLDGIFYKEAVNKMLKKNICNPIFVLTSDDNNFWNEIKTDIAAIFNYENYIIDKETEINTFILLQQFNNFIMSNSTFIWWCVWLSNSKNVIVPSKWFGPAGPSHYEDIYEENWERI